MRDGFRHLTRLAAGEPIDHDAAGRDVLVPPISDRWGPVFDRVADGWWGQLMIAIREHAAGRLERAERCYRRSHELTATAWSDRGLALVAAARGETDTATSHYLAALSQAPDCLPLLIEAGDHLLAVDQAEDCLRLIDAAPADLATHGRVLVQRVRAYLACGRTAVRARAPGRRYRGTGSARRRNAGPALARGVRRPRTAHPLRLPDAPARALSLSKGRVAVLRQAQDT